MEAEKLLTTELRDGRRVLAKTYKGDVCAKTYANLTYARRVAQRLGSRWYVTGAQPFYVTYGSKL